MFWEWTNNFPSFRRTRWKKNTENGDDSDRKQIIGGEYIDKELEDV